jgi:hypothetical protein
MLGSDPPSEGSRCEGVAQGSLPALASAPRQAFASAGGHAGAGCRHSPHSVHGMASQLPCHLPLTLPVCSPGEDNPLPRACSPHPRGQMSVSHSWHDLSPSFLHGFPLLTSIACAGPLYYGLWVSVCGLFKPLFVHLFPGSLCLSCSVSSSLSLSGPLSV